MKSYLLAGLVSLGICASGWASTRVDYPQISFVGPSAGKKTVDRSEFVILVVEGSVITHERSPLQSDGLVGHINGLLKAKGASYVGVHIREGARYGDVVRALDTLRLTDTKSISVSLVELPLGRDL
ncbi:MAG TPA: hypothetical protein PLN52_06995 [Opitutaceae bacterium]|nr:hypothetical protein [Opitutaceae bacterium]